MPACFESTGHHNPRWVGRDAIDFAFAQEQSFAVAARAAASTKSDDDSARQATRTDCLALPPRYKLTF